jgi:transposase
MDTELTLEHERVDDIPVILAMAKAMGVPEVLDRHLGNHGLQLGLSNGWLASVWLSYILSEGDHRKSALEPWIERRRGVLEGLTGQALRDAEGNDDRLGRLLTRLSDDEAWAGIEADLWQGSVMVLGPVSDEAVERVHLDSTTSYGYHAPDEDGLMRLGHSKDHRPDLAQFKLMAAVAAPARQMLAVDVVPGHRADDGLYLPLIRRVRTVLGTRGLLYVGDAKMAAKDTRAAIAAGDDFYLTVLPKGAVTSEIDAWLQQAYTGEATIVEHRRTISTNTAGHHFSWQERVILYRSDSHRRRLNADLDERLATARRQLFELTPEPGRGKRLFTDHDKLSAAIGRIERQQGVAGLLWVTWRSEAHPSRRDPQRRRFVVTGIHEKADSIARRRAGFGWRVMVTNAAPNRLAADQAPLIYNQSWTIEQQFHTLKDRPLGIQPLNVSRDDQIVGLTRLLILALRLMTLIEVKVRRGLAQTGASLAGLYEGQPKRATDRPTARRLLRAFYRAQVTLTRIRGPAGQQRHITPLSPLLCSILDLLNLPHSTYTDLARLPAQ